MVRTIVELLAGNDDHAGEFDSRFDDVQDAQHPDAVTVCCSDSRVLQDHMWGNDEPGHVFTCGNIGNRVVQRADAGEAGSGESAPDEVVSGDVLYPIAHTGTDTAVVVGHTGCGAVTATYDALAGDADPGSEPPGIEHCLDLLGPHLKPGIEALPDDADRAEAINRLVEYNVDRQVEFLVESDEVPERVEIVGAVYDFQDVYGGSRGEVHVVNVDGERGVEGLREEYPEIASRVGRLWEY
ncbi:carbonic anhydrase [Halorussus halobius]|uniref:carbonic anhydrase n=1 Tax=Halorussus halobius TaxID=1710537 RepID=UPI00109273CD|nr:carbonic anhydrase [Halorussus halobius]